MSGLVLLVGCSGSSHPLDDTPGGQDGAASSGGDSATLAGPTFHKDVEPLLQRHCQGCHVTGGIAPFALFTYDDAKGNVGLMVAETASRLMPPWGAVESPECTPPLSWKNDPRLTDAEINLLAAWKDNGTPEGNIADAPPPLDPKPLGLAGVQLELTPAAPFKVTTTDSDTFRCFVLDPKLTSTAYVNGTFVVPGNAQMVHHALVFIDPTGQSAQKVTDGSGSYDCFGGTGVDGTQLLSAWAPGSLPAEYPADVGVELPPGALLVMQVHYHPHATVTDPSDATTVQLRFTDQAPSYRVISSLIGNFRRAPQLLPGPDDPATGPEFVIPAGADAHTESMQYTIAAAALGQAYLYSVGAHMHYVGSAETIRLQHHGQTDTQCLLNVPKWDFDWQRSYSYDVPITDLPIVKTGDTLDITCTYNNSPTNAKLMGSLREREIPAPVEVRLGESTLDEMCLSILAFVYKSP